ncbi:hypothetical protein F9U64_03865 [Gracilibacillus oryzae]|uniref:Swarming motility protein SwrB n=1 Tax=Gracilibacillus oryzae TaxID=1672701 RepID=A0A7C8GVG3_9BACI|nr:hypothetical protein [Gracilibacillus oryzae]KAB8138764.1 hypothetical protein F9U64_03865 [Gracilibacillus oryzae]
MVYLLLLFSFIIHIVTFVIIRQMKTEKQRLLEIEQNVNEQIDKMENTLALYLVEMREENENFTKELDLIQKKQRQREPGTAEKRMNLHVEHKEQAESSEDNYSKFVPLTETDQQDIVEQSETAKILHLYNNGESIEEIAKKLDKGKTEIELLLKFQQKNE